VNSFEVTNVESPMRPEAKPDLDSTCFYERRFKPFKLRVGLSPELVFNCECAGVSVIGHALWNFVEEF
jgi:hypothetical protein